MHSILKRIILVRHAESVKTIHDTHGGVGMPLTALGRADCIRIANHVSYLGDFTVKDAILLTGPSPQARETAEILGNEMGLTPRIQIALRGIHMGIFDGRTDQDAWLIDPGAARRLKLWRDGQIPVDAINIPGAEDLHAFRLRLKTTLDRELLPPVKLAIIIVTRSVGIALLNTFAGVPESVTESYRRYRLEPGSISVVEELSDAKWSITALGHIIHLDRSVDYPDT